jgi:dTDP-4-amino-4,6-dideoxygalactose transaminase
MIPFNDLSRIHAPLLEEFQAAFEKIVLTSSFVLGEHVKQFEIELASLEDARFAVGVNNGTSALELAIRALGLESGDEVITSALTFVATVHAIQQAGVNPVLVDISPNFPLLDPSKLEEKITSKTKAIVVVSLHGIIDGLDEYRRVADKFGLKLILDGAQSHLGRFERKSLLEYFEMVTLSFYPGKNLGALGEGGAVLTNEIEYAEKLRLFRDWGSKEKYKHETWGGNYRLEPLQAAMLRIKLPLLEKWTNQRKSLATSYQLSLPSKLLSCGVSPKGDHVYHMFTIQTDFRARIQTAFNENNIGWGIHYPRAVHQNPFYSSLEIRKGEFKNSEKFASTTLSIPIFPEMRDDEQAEVVKVLLNSID